MSNGVQENSASVVVTKDATMNAQCAFQRLLPDFQQFADLIHFLRRLFAAQGIFLGFL